MLEALWAKVSKLEQQCQLERQQVKGLTHSLESEHASQTEQNKALETLQGQLEETGPELGPSQAATALAQRELRALQAKAQNHRKLRKSGRPKWPMANRRWREKGVLPAAWKRRHPS